MLRLIPAAAAALVLALAAPAMGQQFSDADRAAVSARLDAVHDQVVAGDMSAAMDVLPPGIIEGIAARYGVTPQQAREAGREAAAAAMDQVEIVEYRIDMDAAEVRLTPDGRRTYVIVPLHMTMRIQNITARALSPTLAFEVDGAWYAMNVEDAEQVAVLVEVYPEFAGVDFPKGTMELIQD